MIPSSDWPYLSLFESISLDSVAHHLLLTWRSLGSKKYYSSLSFRPFWETKDSPESPWSDPSNLLFGGLLSFAIRPWQRQNLSPYTQNLRISIPPSNFVQSEKERVR